MQWLTFAGVFALFFATHSIPVRPLVKRHLVNILGSNGFTAAYSMLSILMLVLLIWATRNAPFVLLWSQAPWHRPVVWLGMLVVCLILGVSLGRPNPFSFGGRANETFNPAAGGIIGYVRHPLLVGLALWAALHLLINGDLAHVILFGTLSVFAVFGQRTVDMRKQRVLGPEHWQRLLSETRKACGLQLPSRATVLRIFVGVLVYVLLVALHPAIIGRSVFM